MFGTSLSSMLNALTSTDGGAGAAIGGLFGLMSLIWAFYCVLIIVGIVVFILWLWMLIDCLKRENFTEPNDKLIWALVIIFASWIGALLYYFLVKRKLDKKA